MGLFSVLCFEYYTMRTSSVWMDTVHNQLGDRQRLDSYLLRICNTGCRCIIPTASLVKIKLCPALFLLAYIRLRFDLTVHSWLLVLELESWFVCYYVLNPLPPLFSYLFLTPRLHWGISICPSRNARFPSYYLVSNHYNITRRFRFLDMTSPPPPLFSQIFNCPRNVVRSFMLIYHWKCLIGVWFEGTNQLNHGENHKNTGIRSCRWAGDFFIKRTQRLRSLRSILWRRIIICQWWSRQNGDCLGRTHFIRTA